MQTSEVHQTNSHHPSLDKQFNWSVRPSTSGLGRERPVVQSHTRNELGSGSGRGTNRPQVLIEWNFSPSAEFGRRQLGDRVDHMGIASGGFISTFQESAESLRDLLSVLIHVVGALYEVWPSPFTCTRSIHFCRVAQHRYQFTRRQPFVLLYHCQSIDRQFIVSGPIDLNNHG